MTMTWNGYKPGETRVVKMKVLSEEGGHSMVESITHLTQSFRWRWSVKCECGKVYSSRVSPMTAYYTLVRHQAKEAAA